MEIDSNYFDTQSDFLFAHLNLRAEHDTHRKEIAKLRCRFDQNKSKINIPAINYCINEFIYSELDTATPGIRGLGRLTAFVPRLGGYFRNQISSFSSSQIEELLNLILSLIIQPYIFSYSMLLESDPDIIRYDPYVLYEIWVPCIYELSISQPGAGPSSYLVVISEPLFNTVMKYFNLHRMKPGFLQHDKRRHILTGYIQAGAALATSEHTIHDHF